MNVLEMMKRINSEGEYTMQFYYVCSIWVVFHFIHKIHLIGISDEITGHKLYCTVVIFFSYFSTLRTTDFLTRLEERLTSQRSKEFEQEMTLLIPQIGEKLWGEKRKANKRDMLSSLVGYRHRMNNRRDNLYMSKYLDKVNRTGLDKPRFLRDEEFLPLGAPLLDFLVEETKKIDGWKYPRLEELELFQSRRGLSLDMLDQIEVRELVCGIRSQDKILETHQWITDMYKADQSTFGTRVISMDVEDVKTTYYDTLRMAGKLEIPSKNSVLRTDVESEVIYRFGKDVWKQIPGKIMIGNGISWVCIISLNMSKNHRGEYYLERMEIQPEIIDLLQCLPVSAGLGVRRDVRGVQEFFSLISGKEVILKNGFIDLTSLAVLAGYKFHSKNMTAMGVQVMGSLLNKMVSTADDLWGLKWDEIPGPLKCYALGDIKFGFITYNVLAGLLLRDVFPDPDVLCWYLESDQFCAVTWFLDWILRSLEGVEVYQMAEEEAETRVAMIKSLRFRDDRDKLESDTTPLLKVWMQVLGSWPSVTSGGCRILLQAREWFGVQSEILSKVQLDWSNEVVFRLPRVSDKDYLRFGLKEEELLSDSWKNPVPGVRGMTRPPGMHAGFLVFDPSVDLCSKIGELCSALGRNQRWCILEWARMFPEKFKAFFARMMRDTEFRLYYKMIYDCMRLSYRRIFDIVAPRVARVELGLAQGVLNTLAQETRLLEKSRKETALREARVNWLTELSKDSTFRERSKWREGIPELPVWRRRGGQKRSYSKVQKPGKDQRKRLRLARQKPSSDPNPGDASAVDRDAAVSVVTEKNDPGCSGVIRGVVSSRSVASRERARSRNKKSARVLTYDEIIEGEDSIPFPDNLEFRFEIPDEVEGIELS